MKTAAGAFLLALALTPFAGAKPDTLDREKIPAEFKWDVSQIYPNWDAWENAVKETEANIAKFAALKGTLKNGAPALLAAYQLSEKIGTEADKIYSYTSLQRDTDSRNQLFSGKYQRVIALLAKHGTAASWFSPELLAIPQETAEKWIAETPALAQYRFPILNEYRLHQHVLDEKSEKLLSYGAQFASTPRSIFQELSISDIKFPKVTLSNGKEVTLTPGNYRAIIESAGSQEDRRKAAELHFSAYSATGNTYAAIYNSILQNAWAGAQERSYPSALAAKLDVNNIPQAVFDNLLKTAHEGTKPLQRYLRLKQKLLGLKELHLYDSMVPVFQDDSKWDFADAKTVVLEAVKPLGNEYHQKLEKFLKAGRIDVYENEGKRSGAYNMGIAGMDPYVLLNYNETDDAVFTLAHELGHSMHSVFSTENQPYATADYTIFVAEVASTTNERFLLDELLRRTNDPKKRFLLLQKAAENIVGTFYTQTLFASFEKAANDRVQRGESITVEELDKIYNGLLKQYYGDAIVIDPWYNKSWMRIPHFYNSPYYVYQYATCFASSAQVYNAMMTGDDASRKAALDRYLTLLKSGGNDYPMEQLKKAGVDLTKHETVQAVVDQMDQLVTQLEAEAEKIKAGK